MPGRLEEDIILSISCVDLDNKMAALPAQVDGLKQPLAAQRYLFDYEEMNEMMSENENRDDEDLSFHQDQ